MNIKKIGLTALAASLVSTSVFAGELTVRFSFSNSGKLFRLEIMEKVFQWVIVSFWFYRTRQWNDCFNVF